MAAVVGVAVLGLFACPSDSPTLETTSQETGGPSCPIVPILPTHQGAAIECFDKVVSRLIGVSDRSFGLANLGFSGQMQAANQALAAEGITLVPRQVATCLGSGDDVHAVLSTLQPGRQVAIVIRPLAALSEADMSTWPHIWAYEKGVGTIGSAASDMRGPGQAVYEIYDVQRGPRPTAAPAGGYFNWVLALWGVGAVIGGLDAYSTACSLEGTQNRITTVFNRLIQSMNQCESSMNTLHTSLTNLAAPANCEPARVAALSSVHNLRQACGSARSTVTDRWSVMNACIAEVGARANETGAVIGDLLRICTGAVLLTGTLASQYNACLTAARDWLINWQGLNTQVRPAQQSAESAVEAFGSCRNALACCVCDVTCWTTLDHHPPGHATFKTDPEASRILGPLVLDRAFCTGGAGIFNATPPKTPSQICAFNQQCQQWGDCHSVSDGACRAVRDPRIATGEIGHGAPCGSPELLAAATPDAGVPDAGTVACNCTLPPDAGAGTPDAGVTLDAGTMPDAGAMDAGMVPDAGTAPMMDAGMSP